VDASPRAVSTRAHATHRRATTVCQDLMQHDVGALVGKMRGRMSRASAVRNVLGARRNCGSDRPEPGTGRDARNTGEAGGQYAAALYITGRFHAATDAVAQVVCRGFCSFPFRGEAGRCSTLVLGPG